MVVLIVFAIVLVIPAVVTGLVLGLRLYRPSYPPAQPWWRRTQMYQISVATWANDVLGPIGRLADVIPRMAYLSHKIGATSIILTGLLASDANGVTNWTLVDNALAAPDEAIQSLIPQLVRRAKSPNGLLSKTPEIKIVLGISFYATSDRHDWFQQSRLAQMSRFSTFYLWTTTPPSTAQEHRYFAFDTLRQAYYRHMHGNPKSPLLNLTNAEVQTELKKAIQYWKTHLNIKGIMITNSTNVIPQMMSSVGVILNDPPDGDFVWFADDPSADAAFNRGQKVCFFTITINRRVPTRENDLTAQIVEAMNDTRLSTCSPIWRVVQLSQENKDYRTVQQIAYFLPGSFLMMAGQEVDLSNGDSELMHWSYERFNDFSTYWPININLPRDGLDRLNEWKTYWRAATRVTLLATAQDSSRLMIIQSGLNENLFSAYREHKTTRDRIYFVVSFQTLNTVVQFASIFYDLQSPKLEVSYDTKAVYHGRRYFGETTLVNNQVLLLYYY